VKAQKKGKAKKHLKPKSIPVLTSVQFRVVTREMERAPSQADLDRTERVKKIIDKGIP
jgi:hypothetical protein